MEQTTAVGEKDIEAGALCFEPMDGVQEEMLDPIWSELDGFGNGVLNGLLSSDIHSGGAVAEMDAQEHSHGPGTEGDFKMLKVNEEFAHYGSPGSSQGGMDASLGGVVNVHDYLTIKDMPQSNTEAPYGLALPGSHENLGFHGNSFQVKEELLIDELDDSSVGLENSNDNAECGFQKQEQFLQANTGEGGSSREALKLHFLGVGSVRNILEGTVNFNELWSTELPSKQNDGVLHGAKEELVGVVNVGAEKIVPYQEGEYVAKVNEVLESNPVEQDVFRVEGDARASEVDKVNRIKEEDDQEVFDTDAQRTGGFKLLKVKEEFSQHGDPETSHAGIDAETASFEEELVGKEVGKGSVGQENSNGHAESVAQTQEKFLLQVKTEEGASHEEKLNVGLFGEGGFNNGAERTLNVYELRDTQLSSNETAGASLGVEQEMWGVVNVGSKKIVVEEDESGGKVNVVVKVEHENDQEESDMQDGEVDDEEIHSEEEDIDSDRALISADNPQLKISHGFISEMFHDGSLSVEGLAGKGLVVISEDESASDEDGDGSSDDEEDEESDGVTSIADTDEEDVAGTKSKAKTARKGKEDLQDAEEIEPPRTKHELHVLPHVPKVTVVLKPQHTTKSVGHISSVLDLRVIVESSGLERILNENSIIWLTDSRVPLGIVDEVFGPVKNPFYVIRFNELAEIPEDAKTGADVSYVSEFSDFVLKDNPSLYSKAVDASGLDDEELGSDEDVEFSDDEKEAAARMRHKTKRALDNQGDRQGQGWNSAKGQHLKGQRTEGGRGRGRSGWRGAATANAVDSAVDFVAGMELQGSPWSSARPGSNQLNGRRWNRGRQNSTRNSGHQESHTRGSRAGPSGQQRSSSQYHESPQRRDGLYFAEQANRHMFNEQANRQMIAQQANRQMLAESANRQMLAQQANQAGGMQVVPFNAGAIPAHLQGQGVLRQQRAAGLQAYGYSQVPGYDGRQGSVYSVPGGPQFLQNSVVFSNPNLLPNPFFNSQGQGQMNTIHNPGYGSIVHAGQLNFGVPVHHSLGDAQARVHPSLLGNGEVTLDHRNLSMQGQNSQYQGPQWHGPNKYYQ